MSGTGCARARYAWRNLRRNPGFAAVAIPTLALGIGGVTAMFSAFDTILIPGGSYTTSAHDLSVIRILAPQIEFSDQTGSVAVPGTNTFT